jgi:hypothetical protein
MGNRCYRTDAALPTCQNGGVTDTETAVLQAARKWIAAKEEILAADEGNEDQLESQHAFDAAEYELTNAVYRLLGREPKMPRD